LVGLVVIGAEFGRKDHDSIFATAIGRELKSLDARTDPRTIKRGAIQTTVFQTTYKHYTFHA
jgi:hypothetical protein